MDDRLVAWARAVKRRHRATLPTLWLFTDPVRHPDLLAAIARLPGAPAMPGLCGVVFRHDDAPDRAALALAARRLCRERGIVMVVAGDPHLAASLGLRVHARAGRGRRCLTASAHGAADLVRAGRAGAGMAFLSPAFPTNSHKGAPWLGPLRWAGLSRGARIRVAALGGVTSRNVKRLPSWLAAVGAIGAVS